MRTSARRDAPRGAGQHAGQARAAHDDVRQPADARDRPLPGEGFALLDEGLWRGCGGAGRRQRLASGTQARSPCWSGGARGARRAHGEGGQRLGLDLGRPARAVVGRGEERGEGAERALAHGWGGGEGKRRELARVWSEGDGWRRSGRRSSCWRGRAAPGAIEPARKGLARPKRSSGQLPMRVEKSSPPPMTCPPVRRRRRRRPVASPPFSPLFRPSFPSPCPPSERSTGSTPTASRTAPRSAASSTASLRCVRGPAQATFSRLQPQPVQCLGPAGCWAPQHLQR